MAATASSSSSPSSRRVPISIIDGRAYVWSSSDVLHLRTHHRIIGILTGSLPLLPQQNAYLGLPLQLMPEEVALLLQRDAALLVDDEGAHGAPTKEEWEAWEAERQGEVRRQRVEAYRGAVEHKRRFEAALRASGGAGGAKAKAKGNAKGTSKSGVEGDAAAQSEMAKAAVIAEKRRARQEEKRRQRAAEGGDDEREAQGSQALDDSDNSDVEADAGAADAADADANADAEEDPSDEVLAGYTYTHITQDASVSFPWYRPPSSPSSPSSRALASPFLQHDDDPSARAKQRIFTSLNDRGFFLSCGLRFGGDFVAYPGDPFRYHSHYTVTVPQDEESPIPAAKLIADGRLGTAVKKVHVVGTVPARPQPRGDEDEPSFYSLTWAGFGT